MAESKQEQIQEMKEQIGEAEFLQTLAYYNLRIERDSILCPFHNDRHYSNCKIMKKRQDAYCFVCQRRIDAIDLVSYYEGSGFRESLYYLWTDILGRDIPEIKASKNKKRKILSFSELKYLGLAPQMNSHALFIENEIFRMDEPPAGYAIDWKYQDEEGYCPVGKMVPRYTFYELYEENKEAALLIIKGKITELTDWYNEKLKELNEIQKEEGDRERKEDRETRNMLMEKLASLEQISAKIRKAAV